ncbi:MAG: transporter substrate-binding domain-containing protein [Chloroflexaceae bacterium]|nr:transporter substrate-binding domain-containing protein [Chloroflexaceae bacterium]
MIQRKILGLGLIVALLSGLAIGPPVIAVELAEIQERGKLIVGVKDNLRPLAFYDERGNLQGLEIDLARKLAEMLLGSPEAVVFHPLTNRDRLEAVIEGRVDIAIAQVGFTESRARLVTFSPRYYLDGTALVTKIPGITKLTDLTGRRVGVLQDSTTIGILRSRLPGVQLVGVDSYQAALTLLATGEADAFAADATVLSGWVQQYPQYRLLPASLSAAALSVVMPKGVQYVDLHRRINQAIADLYESGWLQARAAHWGLPLN